jgi:putative ABC transport system permease protein
VLGIGLGAGIAGSISYFFKDIPTVVEPFSVILALTVSAAVGIFFGFYPALRASSLDPIEALRYE